MTSTESAAKARFTNDLSAILGADEARDLEQFVGALLALLKVERSRYKPFVERENNPADVYLLQTFAAVARDLEKLLHQAHAVRSYRRALGRLAFTVLFNLLRNPSRLGGGAAHGLPLTDRLMRKLAKELTADQKRSLRYGLFANEEQAQLAGTLSGSSLGELHASYLARVRESLVGEQRRLASVLRTAKQALTPDDYAFLRTRVIGVPPDVDRAVNSDL